MYVHGIRELFGFADYVVAKTSMAGDLVQVDLQRDAHCRLACRVCGATMARNQAKLQTAGTS